MKITVPSVPVGGTTPVWGRIAWWAENVIIRAFKMLFNELITPFSDAMSYAFAYFFDLLEEEILLVCMPLLDELLDIKALPRGLKNELLNIKSTKHMAWMPVLAGIVIALPVAFIMAVYEPLKRKCVYEVEHTARSERGDAGMLSLFAQRGWLSSIAAKAYLNDLGLPDDIQNAYSAAAKTWFTLAQETDAYYRQRVSLVEYKAHLMTLGYTDRDIDHILELIKIIPPIPDLIRMAVRDTWNEKAVAQYGYDEDFPTAVADWSAKQGMGGDWALRYWRAHWELPSVGQAFEMLHRGQLTTDELETFLRIADIPSFWRKKLIAISYAPYTRVDLRRMYDLAVLNENELLAAYTDIGYNTEKATKLVEWTIKEYGDTERQATKAEVLTCYRDRIIDRTTAIEMLKGLELGDELIDLLLAKEDLTITKQLQNEAVENVRLSYVGKFIEINDVYNILGKLNLPAGFIEDRLSIWNLQRQRGILKPTKTEVKDFALKGLITVDELITILTEIGVENKYIDLYVEAWLTSTP
jgi:hypothetical protein